MISKLSKFIIAAAALILPFATAVAGSGYLDFSVSGIGSGSSAITQIRLDYEDGARFASITGIVITASSVMYAGAGTCVINYAKQNVYCSLNAEHRIFFFTFPFNFSPGQVTEADIRGNTIATGVLQLSARG